MSFVPGANFLAQKMPQCHLVVRGRCYVARSAFQVAVLVTTAPPICLDPRCEYTSNWLSAPKSAAPLQGGEWNASFTVTSILLRQEGIVTAGFCYPLVAAREGAGHDTS